jgi:c-di-GMP-binding flagellar brake protein YcgR
MRAEDDRIYLSFPAKNQEVAEYFYEGQEIVVDLITRSGMRKYNSIVIDSPMEGDFSIEYYEDPAKIQRRQYVRVDRMFDLILYHGKDVIKTKTINISGGGLRFVAKQNFILGDIWEFSLYLPKVHFPVKGNGEIIYMVHQENSYNYSVIDFRSIREMDRNKIMRACFEAEAEEINQEL